MSPCQKTFVNGCSSNICFSKLFVVPLENFFHFFKTNIAQRDHSLSTCRSRGEKKGHQKRSEKWRMQIANAYILIDPYHMIISYG